LLALAANLCLKALRLKNTASTQQIRYQAKPLRLVGSNT